MGEGKYYKVDTILVEEILKHQQEVYIEDTLKVKAVHELSCFLREIATKKAARLSGFVRLLRGIEDPGMSENLKSYISTRSNYFLRSVVKDLIIECSGGGYSTFSMAKNWDRVRKGIFWFYYYKDQSFVNVYTIPESDLPRCINREFDDKDLEVYRERLRGSSN